MYDERGICESENPTDIEDCESLQNAADIARKFGTFSSIAGGISIIIAVAVIRLSSSSIDDDVQLPPQQLQSDVAAMMASHQQSLQSSSESSQEKKYQMLEKLDDMKNKGIISEEEFQKEKDTILNS